MTVNAMALRPAGMAPPMMVFDPTLPIPRLGGAVPGGDAFGQNQRNRRSMILAAIRRLLVNEGLAGVTVRRIAECSGHAVQTIYNLVGPRDLAITEAVTEYSQYVCLTANPNPADPHAAVRMIDRELRSIEVHPEFCRNVCQIYFSESRGIFYDFRARQTRMLHGFLVQQQKSGVIRPGADTRGMAENFMLFMGAVFVEWSDSCLPREQLRQRLYAGYHGIMADAIQPAARWSQTGD